jgi:hypothetical protein
MRGRLMANITIAAASTSKTRVRSRFINAFRRGQTEPVDL